MNEINETSSVLLQKMKVFELKHPSLAEKIHLEQNIELLETIELDFAEKKLFLSSWETGCKGDFE